MKPPGITPGFLFPVLKHWKNGRALSEFGRAYDFGRAMHVGGSEGAGVPTPGGVWGRCANETQGEQGGILAAVVTAWPDLPATINAGILAMVKATSGKAE